MKSIPSLSSTTGEIRCLTPLICTRRLVNWPQLEQIKLIVPQNITGDRSNRPGHSQVRHSWLVEHLGQSQLAKIRHMVLCVHILPCLQWKSHFRPVMLSVRQNRIEQNRFYWKGLQWSFGSLTHLGCLRESQMAQCEWVCLSNRFLSLVSKQHQALLK